MECKLCGWKEVCCDSCHSKIGLTEWVKCSDKLPKKYDRVLVTNGKEVCIHYKQSGVNFPDERGHDLYCAGKYDDCRIYEGEVTHWMPLPPVPSIDNDSFIAKECKTKLYIAHEYF